MTYESMMKILGIKNSIYLLNIKFILSIIWKSIACISKDNIEQNLYKTFEESLINNKNYFDEFYERVVLNALDELELEEQEMRNSHNMNIEENH